MKKVGIVSCYFKDNYGSLLQAYANQKVLDDCGISNETIDVSNLKDFRNGKIRFYLSQILNFKFIRSKLGMIKFKFDKKFNKKLSLNIKERNLMFNEFKRKFNLSEICSDYNTLSKLASKKYSDIIVGSDQLWLPVNVVSDYYTLNWVPDNVNKISYATSFGVSSIQKKYRKQYNKFLNRINCLSVREESGIDLIKDIANLDAKLVCDPTILLSADEWDKLSYKTRFFEEKYIFCYFLGNNIEHRKFVERLKEYTGLKIVSINHCDEYVKYSDKFADYTPYNVGPFEWINLIKNAEYVCTDSFHGTVFSILFNKIFFNFRRHNSKNINSTNSRLDSLLKVANISKNRILSGNENIEDVLNLEIDYNSTNNYIENFRQESKKWLFDSLSFDDNDNYKYINVYDKTMCTGCSACKNICPKGAIEMIRDEEGFLYPNVIKEKCINCGLCKKCCPILNKKNNEMFEQKCFVFQHKNDEIRYQSTSGGAFTAIASYVLDQDGVVFGVAFDEKFKVVHQFVENKDELWRFRNSKYVQSDCGESFKKVKEFLLDNKLVLFSGTSCQIAGLKHFLGKSYSNLILVDVVCRAVPSPLMWEKYLETKKIDISNIKNIYFREKIYGYKYSNFSIHGDNYFYHNGIDSDPYLRAFFSNICDRPSCYCCKFKTQFRDSDITLWDCFNVDSFYKELDDDKGTTRILCNTLVGFNIIQNIAKDNVCKEIPVSLALKDFNGIFSRVRYNSLKDDFVKDMNSLDSNTLFKKYFSENIFTKLEKYCRMFFLKNGLYKIVIKLVKKIKKRR